MEAQYVPAAGEPPKVRNRKPETRNPSDQGPQAQQPRRSNRAPQPRAETWGHDEYGHADPAQSYGYGTGEHVDAHGYGFGSAHLDAAGQGYGYGYEGAQADVGQGYDYGYDHGYGGAQADVGQGYDYGYDHGYGGAQAGHNYDAQGNGHGYGDGYDGGQAAAGQEYAYDAPAQHVQGNPKKSRKPRPVAAGAEVQGDYANPKAYNAVDPSQQNPPKRESKPRRTKSLEKRNQDNGEVPEPGSARSRTSQEGSGSNRSQRRDGIARDQESAHSGKSGSARSGGKSMTRPTEATGNNALNEHVRKAGGGKPPVVQDVSMAVFDPRDRTLIAPEARPSLDEWMKMQGNLPVQQDESLIVFDDHDKEELETRMFGGPLPKPNKQPPMKLPPLQEEQQRPQYHPRGRGAAPNLAIVPADDKPLYQPTQRQRQPSPLPQGGAIQSYNKPVYNNDDANNMEIQAVQPNPKCMACVHGVGVPIARLATRIACKNACLCTIL